MNAAHIVLVVQAKLAQTRKLIAYIVSVATSLLAFGLLPADVATYVSAAIAVLGAVGLYKVPNEDPDAEAPANA